MSVASDMIGRMDTGQKASAVLHLGLVGWVLVFDLFHAPSDDMERAVAEVSLVSATEFAALSAPPAPEPTADPTPPPRRTPAPQPEPEPQPDTAPEPDSTGAIFSPQPTPGVAERPAPRPVDRVAPTPTEAPPEDAAIDLTARPQTSADAPGDVVLPEQEQVAPPEATTEIVTEATETDTDSLERAAAAPTVSPRPRTRPERPALAEGTNTAEPTPDPAPEPTPEPAADPDTTVASEVADAVAAALADSLAGIGTVPPQTGLSASEADRLRLAIQQCWNIGTLSTEAQQVTVTVGFSMTPGAVPEQGTIYMVDNSGGSEGAVSQAFDAARRAIIRCQGDGYGLPPESYDAWRDVEITFNPEGMRLR